MSSSYQADLYKTTRKSDIKCQSITLILKLYRKKAKGREAAVTMTMNEVHIYILVIKYILQDQNGFNVLLISILTEIILQGQTQQ